MTTTILNMIDYSLISYSINFVNEYFIILFSLIIIGTLTSYIHFSGKKVLESIGKTLGTLGALGGAYSGGSQAYKDYKSTQNLTPNSNPTPNSNTNVTPNSNTKSGNTGSK